MTREAAAPVQLMLDLPPLISLGSEDFLVSRSNRDAALIVECWPDWPGRLFLIVGPPGSGKSHLGEIWLARTGGKRVVPGDALPPGPDEAGWPVLVDDADRMSYPDTQLFHVLNAVQESGATLLMTARQPPASWPCTLPDLKSRLSTVPIVRIEPPDEELLAALLVKGFADRQIDVDPAVVLFLARRVARSPSAVRDTVDAIDRRALITGRRITVALAAETLAEDAQPSAGA